MELVKHETCQQYVSRRLSEGWKIVLRRGHYVTLSPPDGGSLRVVDLRNDILTLRPNADATHTFWKLSGGTDHYALVDEATPDEDATYIYRDDNVSGKDSFTFPASGSPAGTISKVTAFYRCKNHSGEHPTYNAGKAFLWINGEWYSGSWSPWPLSYENLSHEWALNPHDSETWEWADIDILEAGVHKGTITDEIRVTQFYIEVDYSVVTTAYKDIATRFRLRVQAFKDTATRFKLAIQGYKDAATRFLLTVGVQAYKDTSTRFRLWAQTYKDTATRFKLTILAYKDTATRFILTALNYQDIAARFKLIAQAYKDIATRFQLTVQAYRDTASRFRLIVQNYRDAATRFRLWVEAYRDTATRFILNVLNYQDIATRFQLTVRAYQDIATRFKLIAQTYRDIVTRFKLSIQTYQDVSTRFFLYQPTWEEIQIQKAVASLKAEIAELELEPKAHFRI